MESVNPNEFTAFTLINIANGHDKRFCDGLTNTFSRFAFAFGSHDRVNQDLSYIEKRTFYFVSTSEASGMSNSLTAFDWIVLFDCNFFPLVAN